ncbi:MAG: HEAT repeat domain-containing protein [Gemmatimonadota bacterium]|nr:HEAT repeat domain-containing protein [Gemmatimonadota bacterium]
MKRLLVAGAAFAMLAAPSLLVAQRNSGTIGHYIPPRTWPQGVHDFNLVHQKIAVQFSEAERLVTGVVTTTVIPGVATDTVRLNAENITIDKATDAAGRPIKFAYDSDHVTVHLARRAPAGDTVVFTLAYHTHPERGIYFVPRRHVIWSQGEATETRAWVPTYDYANDKTTWEFLVTADSGLKVLSNGTLLSVTPVDGGRQDVWHWAQNEKASTYLYSVVVGPFTVLHDQWRGKPVDEYVYPDTVDAGWRAAGETPSMIELYSRLTGVPFPWDKYDQSWIPDFTYGGMENVSATTQTDLSLPGAGNDPMEGSRGLVAHELAHQWFGDYETTANWANAWLNEGLTTYMESVQNEKTRGWDAAQLEWWGQQQQAMQADLRQARPLVWGQYQGTDPIALFFSGHVYPKGAQLAHQLRRLLGDKLFWAGMHRFLVDNAHKPVTTKNYADAFEETCHCDLGWFFDQWAYGIGYPQLDVTRRWDPAAKILHVTVNQVQPTDSTRPLFRFPTTIRVITADSVVRDSVMVQAEKSQTFDMRLPAAPLSFRFDEGGWLLGSVHTDQTPAELAHMAEHDLDTSARNWALYALAQSQDTAAVDARRFIVLNERMPQLRAEALRQMAHDSTPRAVRIVRSALRDPDASVRSAALVRLASLDSAGVADTALAMYHNDISSAARATALRVYATAAGASALGTVIAASGPAHTLGVRITAAYLLSRLHAPSAVDALEQLTDPVEVRELRMQALRGLFASGDTTRAVAVATRALKDYDPLFSQAAVGELGRLGTPAARAALETALKTETRVHVKAAMERALGPRMPGGPRR